jgi:hypothetical protein
MNDSDAKPRELMGCAPRGQRWPSFALIALFFGQRIPTAHPAATTEQPISVAAG